MGVVLYLAGLDFHGGLGVEERLCASEGVGNGSDGRVLAVGIVVGGGGGGEKGWGDDFG